MYFEGINVQIIYRVQYNIIVKKSILRLNDTEGFSCNAGRKSQIEIVA